MAPNQTSSPTSLLWAHQLKREHGFLLDRMNKLETAISRVESAVKAAMEATSDSHIADIAAKMQSLSEDRGSKAMESVRKEVMGRFEDVSAEMAAIVLKVAAMEKKGSELEDDKRKAFDNEKSMQKRVKEVEEQLEEVGRRVEEGRVDSIRQQLEQLTDLVKSDGAKVISIIESLQALEAVTVELKKGNGELADELKELASRPPSAPVLTKAPPAPASLQPQAQEDQPVPAVTQPVEEPISKKYVAKGKARAPGNTQSTETGKSKPIIETLASRRPARTRVKKSPINKRLQQPIIHAGPDYVEVARAPGVHNTPITNSVAEAPQRRRGAPRKAKASQFIEEADPPVPEAAVKRVVGRPRKDESQPVANPSTKRPAALQARSTRYQAQKIKKLRRGLTNVFSSPISSPPTTADDWDTRLPLGLAVSNAQKPPAAKKRRTIKQDYDEEDEALLRQFTGGIA